MIKNPYRRGQAGIQAYVDAKVHRAFKAKLSLEGKSIREVLEKFIRFYADVEEGEEDAESAEAPKADRP